MLYADFQSFDPDTGIIYNRTAVEERVFFLSTVKPVLSETPWNRDIKVSATTQGLLCSAMRRTPNLGSMATEGLVAGVQFFRPFANTLVFLPGLIDMWAKGKACGLDTRGHSLLAKCGADILSFDDFFDSVHRSNAHFWRGIGMVAQHVRALRGDRLANVVDGIAYYGEATLMPNQAYSSFIRSVRLPAKEISNNIMQGVLSMNPIGSLARVTTSTNPLRLAHWSISVITSTIVDLIFMLANADLTDPRVMRRIISVLTNRLYDAKDGFYSSVVLGLMQGCNGLSLMMGYNNPWAIFLRKQCESGPLLLQGSMNLFLTTTVTIPFLHLSLIHI